MTKELENAILSLENFDGTPYFFNCSKEDLKIKYKGNSFEDDLRDAKKRGEITSPIFNENMIYIPKDNTIGDNLQQTIDDSKLLEEKMKEIKEMEISYIANTFFQGDFKRANHAGKRLLNHGDVHWTYGVNGKSDFIVWRDF